MTVADLIRDLQAMPNQNAPVRVVFDRVWVSTPMGPECQDLGIEDAALVRDVRNEGAFVLVKGD